MHPLGRLPAFTKPLGHGAHGLIGLGILPWQIHQLALPWIARRWCGAVSRRFAATSGRSGRLLLTLALWEHSLLAGLIVLLLLAKPVEQLTLLLGRHLLERLARTATQILGLLLLPLGISGPVGELAQPLGQALLLARPLLAWALLLLGLAIGLVLCIPLLLLTILSRPWSLLRPGVLLALRILAFGFLARILLLAGLLPLPLVTRLAWLWVTLALLAGLRLRLISLLLLRLAALALLLLRLARLGGRAGRGSLFLSALFALLAFLLLGGALFLVLAGCLLALRLLLVLIRPALDLVGSLAHLLAQLFLTPPSVLRCSFLLPLLTLAELLLWRLLGLRLLWLFARWRRIFTGACFGLVLDVRRWSDLWILLRLVRAGPRRRVLLETLGEFPEPLGGLATLLFGHFCLLRTTLHFFGGLCGTVQVSAFQRVGQSLGGRG